MNPGAVEAIAVHPTDPDKVCTFEWHKVVFLMMRTSLQSNFAYIDVLMQRLMPLLFGVTIHNQSTQTSVLNIWGYYQHIPTEKSLGALEIVCKYIICLVWLVLFI